MPLNSLIPRTVRLAGQLVPAPLERGLLEVAINYALAVALAEDRLAFLEGRVLALVAPDAGLRWAITLFRGRLLLLPATTEADAIVRGPLAIFLDLARGRIDPDTAFFQRELVVEGDTELGLAAKNALDALDPECLPRPVRHFLSY
ncbi:ubiquinone anaerobic biosynthesis accessory factor UbiT [Arhodomonas sp. SL1]|uniref:ubiquinone anaerobic biosynthesis accessory factor UbiT n=1 Tax=Arhodomonas sp. SL1 TaxID=3425691 RepID=UPI003F88563D